MIKVCSLDFLNNEFFEKDILLENGKVLFKANDKVTTEALLKLYFRNIYIQNPITASRAEAQSKILVHGNHVTGTSEQNNYSTPDFPELELEEQYSQEIADSSGSYQKSSTGSDDYFYTKIVEYSTMFAKVLKLSEGEIKKLEDLAYNYVLKEMNEPIPDEIKDDLQFCYKSYITNEFPLIGKIPYTDIIFIIAYYVKMLKETQSKQKTIYKMLWYGNNKFNPFFLHKFLNMMKED